MTLINIISDLHLTKERIISRQKSDIGIIAGDIAERPEDVMDFGKKALPNASNIIQVPGNHDFIGHTYNDGLNIMKKNEKENHKILENDCYIYNSKIPVRILGGTLWTDFNFSRKQSVFIENFKHVLEDFKRIKDFGPDEWIKRHKETKTFFLDMLSTPFHGATIIVHHHLTGIQSVHEKYTDHPRTDAYVPSDMKPIYTHEKCSLIIHGHTHSHAQWQYNNNSPLVICNPYGNEADPNKESMNKKFNPDLMVKINENLKPVII